MNYILRHVTKRWLPFCHPFLFSIYPILFLYSHNINEIWSIGELFLLISISLSFTLLLFLLAKIILKEAEVAALITSLFIFLFYSYGHLIRYIWTVKFNVFTIFIGRNLIAYTIWLTIFIFSSVFFIKKRKNLKVYTHLATITGLVLITISLLNIITYSIKYRIFTKKNYTISSYEISPPENQKAHRDIYYIILDRYARSDILKSAFKYDNSEFIDFLKSRGFYVASQSIANYPRTGFSLASSLNLEYINYLGDISGKESKDAKRLLDLLSDHRLGRVLKFLGYTYIHFGSYTGSVKWSKIADINYNKFMIPEFIRVFYKTTLLYPIGDRLDLLGEYVSPRNNILYTFNKLESISDIQEPVFVFAHIMLPHIPYIFDRNGNALTESQKGMMSIKEKYIHQLVFTNKKTMALIDSLLSKSAIKPIIVLQSDEGPFPVWYQEVPDRYKKFKYQQVSDEELRHKMCILNTYYLPEADTSVLYPSITPVNSFRVILNLYFNAQLELLPDKNYAIEDEDHPYKILEVTNRLIND